MWRVQDFQVVSKPIGDGACSQVFKSRHTPSGQCYALKRTSLESNEHIDTIVRNEMAIHRRLDHPLVLKCYGAMLTQSGLPVMVLELGRSPGDLFNLMARRPPGEKRFTEAEAAEYTRQLVTALRYCHDQGIIHRDVKLENCILGKDAKIRLADFGWAWDLALGPPPRNKSVGTTQSNSPEMLDGRHSTAADMWSVGVAVYEMLHGHVPFYQAGLLLVKQSIRKARYKCNSQHCPPLAKRLISDLLVVDPAERLTAQGVLDHLWLK